MGRETIKAIHRRESAILRDAERGRGVGDEVVAIPRVGGTMWYRNKWRRARCWAPANGNVKLWQLLPWNKVGE